MLGIGDTTWYRERLAALEQQADPVASSSCVEPSQRAERSGPIYWLKVRANPSGNRAFAIRPDKSKCKGAYCKISWRQECIPLQGGMQHWHNSCDALRCSGPHARYTDRASEYFLGRNIWVILLNSVVLGIEHCNYCSSTRNS